jgi:hypothetical protein
MGGWKDLVNWKKKINDLSGTRTLDIMAFSFLEMCVARKKAESLTFFK